METVSIIGTIGEAQPLLARTTAIDPPGRDTGSDGVMLSHAYYMLGVGEQYRELDVNHATALTYSAVWGCVRVIAQSLASIGWHVYERKNESQNRLGLSDSTAWLLGMQASEEMNALDWRQVMLKDALTWGNGYAEIERDMGGRVVALWRIDPSRVELDRTDAGDLIYVIDNKGGQKPSILFPEDVFHLKGLGPDGLIGYSVISMARTTIRLGMEEEQFGSKFFAKGPMPGGILEVPGSPTAEAMREKRKGFEGLYGGAKNAGRIVVLRSGEKFTPLSLPNNDSQFLESRQFQVTEICRWYGVPPHKLADLERATFSNIEEQERAFVTDCLLPWARRLEMEADLKLFPLAARGRRFTRLNLDALMRGNSQTQTDTVTKKVNSALLTINEGREFFDMNPIEGGDTPLVQGAMIPLKRALEDPEPAPAAAPSQGPNNPPDSGSDPAQPADPPEDVANVFTALLTDAYARALRIEGDKARRAKNKGKLAEHCDEYYSDACEMAFAAQLLPIFAAFLLATTQNAEQAEAMANDAAERHVIFSRRSLMDLGDVPLNWSDRAADIAAAELKLAWGMTR